MLVMCVILCRMIYDMWCRNERKLQPSLKILAVLYPLFAVIRSIFQLQGMYVFNNTASIIGSCFAYLYAFVFFVFLLLWLSSTFEGTAFPIAKWKLFISLGLCGLNVMFGLLQTIGRYEQLQQDNELAFNLIYSGVYICIDVWIVYAFNSRLCRLIVLETTAMDDSDAIAEYQKQFIQLITRQTVILCLLFLLNLSGLLSTLFAIFVPDKYEHNQWRIARVMIETFKVFLVCLLFRYVALNRPELRRINSTKAASKSCSMDSSLELLITK